MKKILTVTLILVFAAALVLALGCSKKSEQGAEGQGTMEQTPAGSTSQGGMADTTGGHTMAAPESAMGGRK